jgi:hypothetical protein
MNYNLILGVFLSMVCFTIGVKYNVRPVAYGSRLGYSSKRSLATDTTWVIANVYLGRLLMLFSLLFLIMFLTSNSLEITPRNIVYGSVLFVFISAIFMFVLIEKHLKRRFFKDGKSKPY